MYRIFFKRFIDIVLSFLGLIILSPVFLILAILIRTKLGSPIIFKQKRIGKDEKLFYVYKFRSMTSEKDKDGNLLPDDKRLTKFGKKLRATSLDELPQIFNILKADMSIIGPRPQLLIDIPFMSKDERRRGQVRPGLTGLAQVSGRNSLNWEDRLAYDIKYIEKITFIKDLKIFFKTFFIVFKKSGIQDNHISTSLNLGEYLLKTNKISYNEFSQKIKQIKDE